LLFLVSFLPSAFVNNAVELSLKGITGSMYSASQKSETQVSQKNLLRLHVLSQII
jgi:hypothetical protein